MNYEYYLSYAKEGTKCIQYRGEKGMHFAAPILVHKETGNVIPLQNDAVISSIQSAIYAIENSYVHLNQLIYGGYDGEILSGSERPLPLPLPLPRSQSPQSVTDCGNFEETEEESAEEENEYVNEKKQEEIECLERELRAIKKTLCEERSQHRITTRTLQTKLVEEQRAHRVTKQQGDEAESKLVKKLDKTKSEYLSMSNKLKELAKKHDDIVSKHENQLMGLYTQLARTEKERDTAKKLVTLYKKKLVAEKQGEKKEKIPLTTEILTRAWRDMCARCNTVKVSYKALYKRDIFTDIGINDQSLIAIIKEANFSVADANVICVRLNTVVQVSSRLYHKTVRKVDKIRNFRVQEAHTVMSALKELGLSVFVGRRCFKSGSLPHLFVRLIDLCVGSCVNMAEFNELFVTNNALLHSFMDEEIYIEKVDKTKIKDVQKKIVELEQASST